MVSHTSFQAFRSLTSSTIFYFFGSSTSSTNDALCVSSFFLLFHWHNFFVWLLSLIIHVTGQFDCWLISILNRSGSLSSENYLSYFSFKIKSKHLTCFTKSSCIFEMSKVTRQRNNVYYLYSSRTLDQLLTMG